MMTVHRGHLVHMSTGYSLGGTERRLLELFEALRVEGWRVSLVTLVDGALAQAAREHGVAVHGLRMRGRWDCGVLRSALKVVSHLRPHVLQSDAVRSHLVARYCAMRLHCPHVSMVATDYWHDPVGEGHWRPLHQFLDLMTSRYSSAYLTANTDLANRLRRFGTPPQRIHVIRHGLRWPDPETLRIETARIRRQWALPPDGPLVVVVAMLRPQKRIEDVLDAWRSIRETYPRARLAIVGGAYAGQSDYLKRLHAQAQQWGLTDVLWVGEVNTGSFWCAAADVVVLPSLSEGIPRVILEAMAAARPIVATNVPGTREIVEHGVTGLLVDACAPAQLADAIASLFADPARRSRMGMAARHRWEQAHRFEQMVDDSLAVYHSLVSQRHAKRGDSAAKVMAPG